MAVFFQRFLEKSALKRPFDRNQAVKALEALVIKGFGHFERQSIAFKSLEVHSCLDSKFSLEAHSFLTLQ